VGAPGTSLPFQESSLQLSRILDGELSKAGMAPAPIRQANAPFYLLRHANLPSALVSLGYWSNDKDRAHLSDPAYVESAARGLAQALLEFSRGGQGQ
jgi:N-acetylmuramoyl-L-alanine amidase